jgi:peptidoglycan/LPS O-acetylase OafA/YrhL
METFIVPFSHTYIQTLSPHNYQESPQDTSRLLGLEFLRGCFAFAVVVWHFQHFYANSSPIRGLFMDPTNRFPFGNLLWPAYQYGHYGVEFFWALSGFIFAHRYADEIARRSLRMGQFTLQRLRRIGPLHYLTLTLVAGLQQIIERDHGKPFIYLYNDGYHFLLNIVGASAWGLEKGYNFNGPFWSVSTEIPIYLIFFSLTLRFPMSRWWHIFLLSLVMKSSGIGGAISECLCYFAMGVLIQRSPFVKLKPTLTRQIFFWGILALSGLGVHLSTHGLRGLFMLIFVSSLLTVFAGKPISNWMTQSTAGFFAAWLGRLSYPVYLMHFPAQLIIVMILGNSLIIPDLPPPNLMMIYVSLTVLLAYLTHRYIEQPIQSLAKRRNDL